MTHISSDDVHHLAQLSNLQLEPQEAIELQADLEAILAYIEQLSELDTSSVEPTYQVTGLENVFRADEIDDYGISSDMLVSLAPESHNGQINVPKVLS
jgi:aspartyl-tRNA(Asn)/glutamyl-tRNA(Gln) amidotransferase subunit C